MIPNSDSRPDSSLNGSRRRRALVTLVSAFCVGVLSGPASGGTLTLEPAALVLTGTYDEWSVVLQPADTTDASITFQFTSSALETSRHDFVVSFNDTQAAVSDLLCIANCGQVQTVSDTRITFLAQTGGEVAILTAEYVNPFAGALVLVAISYEDNESGSDVATGTLVPEASTALLFGFGLIALCLRRRRETA
jgi:hypothetical protein